LRSRFGLAWDRTLVYGTAGLAWGRVEHTMTFRDTAGFNSFDQVAGTQVGYVVGGGIEHAFSPHLSLKVEYQYIDLGSQHHTAVEYDSSGAVSGFRTNIETQTDFHTVRLGLNYKLGH
jgi:outer membrane immunogenic protein